MEHTPNPGTEAYDAWVEASLSLLLERGQIRVNWHTPLAGEPPCGPDEWRTKKRGRVLKMSDMCLDHLLNCLRFAATKPHHRSRFEALVAEIKRRDC